MRNATASGNLPTTPTTPSTQPYSPSVPISLYREVVAELQTAQERLDSLTTQNHQLLQQNRQLRQEIETVVQSAVHLQQVVDAWEPQSPPVNRSGDRTHRGESAYSATPHPESAHPQLSGIPGSAVGSPFAMTDMGATPGMGEALFTEQPETRPRRTTRPVKRADLGGLGLLIMILLIVVSAFGAGYWVVRPLLMQQR
ncbi:bZIP transcription factor [Laspinema olomoucense]|uniref:BZIP transcription factor n=1 Tax=Laspinema olomoucense D3b TaxID=2953688 RepID=A0ABT2NAU6_9CYAN|nr:MULTISPECIES: bZIP transcription factor [unclassified Laspinema]MCT7973858.1 bZIP transcription factor [Laspinema sp. D3d]MCT7978944.1 bZIP transcription factor [Laspinema sp. D3b]MCT7989683.1 bZIP transcription factor [Laspinema sp. D3a]MCT7996338.1 bZIP transcription factor [Laspinema sp. D3c]